MNAAVDGSAIDQVLQTAVDAGASQQVEQYCHAAL